MEVYLSVTKMKSEKPYRESQLAVIVASVNALLNTNGGKLSIKFEDDFVLPQEADGVLRMVEQRLVDIIGSCIYNSNVEVQQFLRGKVVKLLSFNVDPMETLCTVHGDIMYCTLCTVHGDIVYFTLCYHLYLPTHTQVIPISPKDSFEEVKARLNREVPDRKLNFTIEEDDIVINNQVPYTESDSIQFKQLNSEKTKWVSLADRMINKSNKFGRYISAFANKSGGYLYYGISDGGIVEGEVMEEKDQEEIVKKVTKTIHQMIWCGGKLERGKHWDIQFVPVKDENRKEIPSLFVVIISVVPLRGGLFIEKPESYLIGHEGQVEKMSFADWRHRFFCGAKVPRCSVTTQRICHKVLQTLMKYQNDGDFSGFEKFAACSQKNFREIEVKAIILGERSILACKKGQFERSHSLLAKLEQHISPSQTKDHDVLKFRAVYAKSATYRVKGYYQQSYDIAKKGLQLAEMVPAGIITAAFYNFIAIVETLISQQTEGERALLKKSAQDHYIKALQHIQASSIEQEFSIVIADLQQRIHICRAITILGGFASGAIFRKATPTDIKAAETDLTNYQRLTIESYSVTNYRKIYYLFAKSDLRLCQWWQQQKRLTQEERSWENYNIPNFLKEAFHYATKAKELSMKFYFEELTSYAYNRLATITELIIKLKISSLSHPRNINND